MNNVQNEYFQYTIEKKTQTQTQLKQINSLKTNLQKIKKQTLGYIPDSMIIEDKPDSFIIKFKDLTDDVDQGRGKRFDGQFFGDETDNFKILKHYIILRFIYLAITLSKFGIHLPMLNCQHFILDSEQKNTLIFSCRRIYFGYFMTEELIRNNEEITTNKNIPYELKKKIDQGKAKEIEFNEKMTVFSLVCIICYLYTKNHLIDADLEDISTNQLKELLESCKDRSPNERPTLIELKHKYLLIFIREQILDLGTLDIKGFLIEGFINGFIAPNEQITGKLCVMEFFAKIKFVSSFFRKMFTKNQNNLYQFSIEHFQGSQMDECKEFQLQSNTLIYLLVKEELAKLQLDNNKELLQWDLDNTKDEINEFKNVYLESYKQILEDILKILESQSDAKQMQLIKDKCKGQSNNYIREILFQFQQTQPQHSSLFICLGALNKIFKYKHLLDCFRPIQDKLMIVKVYARYDIILQELFNNQGKLIDEASINNIKYKN